MQNLKNTCDGALLCAAIATLVNWLPVIVSILAAVLTLMRIVTEWAAFKTKFKALLRRGK